MSSTSELILPLPLEHQIPVYEHDARFKVIRAGRRWGKTRIAFIAANAGHGPGWEDGNPVYPGLLQGWDVVWLGKDYPQARQIWEEGVEPRYRGLDGVQLNQTERTVKVDGGGTLHIRSAELKSLQGIRGLGARLKGVIIDEAGWLDFDYAWKNVIRPMLMDNQGWAIIMSTTNAGLDGGKDPETGTPISPSGFNRLCNQIAAGDPGRTAADGWAHFYGTAQDNPKIAPSEFQALLREYTEGSLALEQEIYAKLLVGGAGLAFAEWRDDVHIASYDPPPGWRWWAGVDWGYRDPCAITFMAAGPDRDVLARSEIYVREKTPYEAGFLVGTRAKSYPALEYVAGGDDMWAVRDGGPTYAEEFQRGMNDATDPGGSAQGTRIPLISVARGPGSRLAGKMLVHEHLRYQTMPDGKVAPWAGPRLRVHPDCKNLIRTLPALPICPKNSEDVDERADEHAYESVRYALMSRVPRPDAQDFRNAPDDIHPGYDLKKRQRKPRWAREAEDDESVRFEQLQQGHFSTGIRYGGARPTEE